MSTPAQKSVRLPLGERCLIGLTELEGKGPLTLHQVAKSITSAMPVRAPEDGLVFHDLQAMQTMGWIAPHYGDSRRFELTDEGRRVLQEVARWSEPPSLL
ncbi:MAG TPA: hypothetical protein VGO39_14590 [Gaiellaceae bacterium]|jgi:hypothetical protein|nr:hypothetical protein [Gaiellaceae bacterium]